MTYPTGSQRRRGPPPTDGPLHSSPKETILGVFLRRFLYSRGLRRFGLLCRIAVAAAAAPPPPPPRLPRVLLLPPLPPPPLSARVLPRAGCEYHAAASSFANSNNCTPSGTFN